MNKSNPLNGHVEIKPITVEAMIASARDQYEEKGVVVSLAPDLKGVELNVGDTVYFDSWMAAKYPDSKGEVFYLVPFSALRYREYEVSE